MTKLILTAAAMLLSCLPLQVMAEPVQESIVELQRDWAIANYEKQGQQQAEAFETLIKQAETATAAHPDAAGIWIWDGIIRSSFAGVKGGVGALSLAKQSRRSLEKAMSIDPDALDGSAYTSLGTLYFKVPGWPLGFGNDKKAAKLLEKALEINPDGIDPNYFYADYLRQNRHFEKAEQYLLKAQQAAPRPGRELADARRQEEIQAALSEVRAKLGRSNT
jgi:tetratricopeptide (TPR) repeat protein